MPDPNGFGGPVKLLPRRRQERMAGRCRFTHGYAENSRGLGVADMACGLRSGRAHRASGELAYHVLDVMHAFHDASAQGRHVELASTCRRPDPLPTGLAVGELDA